MLHWLSFFESQNENDSTGTLSDSIENMAFLFGKKETQKDKTPLVKTIKSTLSTYRRIVTEPIDYAVGDYVVRKHE